MEISGKPSDTDDEDLDLVSRLATLQDMHDQVLDLRTLLPQRLWNPILATIKTPVGSRPPYSPSALYTHLAETADDGCREMATFKAAWHSTDMQELWEKTKAESVPQGTDTWKVNYRAAVKNLKRGDKGSPLAVGQPVTVKEEPKVVIDKFKTSHPSLKLELPDEVTVWPLALTVAGMIFEIERQVVDDADIYQSRAKPGRQISNIQQQIVKLVQQRKNPKSLAYLLDMLASYEGMRNRTCEKCQKIIDDNLQFAILRESKDIPDGMDGKVKWLAYHRDCA